MRQKIGTAVACSLLAACASAFGYNNPIEGGATETVTNVWNVAVPWLMVGSNTGSNTLEIVDGGQVNSQIGYLGNTPVSTHNQAVVNGSGVWSNAQELSVGYGGAHNILTVVDGGTVITPNAYIGNYSSGNRAMVSGTGSLLDASILNVGHQGDGNSMLITDGGSAQSDIGTIGYWIGSDNNTATVQSNGDWNSSAELNIGEYGSGNQLMVGAGGYAGSPVVNVGVQTLSSSNTVSVNGVGAWLDAPELHIGGSAAGAGGTGNLVEVQNGGTVYTESLNIFSGNSFDLNDGGRLFVNNDFDASLSGFSFNAGGTLEVGGTLTGMDTDIEEQRTLVLSSADAEWKAHPSSISIGDVTGGNALIITNGALVENVYGYIGGKSTANSNSVIVSGSGSVWSNALDVHVGSRGSGNSLIIENGGRVENRYSTIGYLGSDDNSLVVTGTNTVLVTSGLDIGNTGCDGNSLSVEDGGHVVVSGNAAMEGDQAGLLVTGDNSVLDISESFKVSGENGNFIISNGGRVEDTAAYVGFHLSDDNNNVRVTGDNSVWDNSSLLYIGVSGDSNSLIIADGGRVNNTGGRIGSSSDGNTVYVSGAGSIWQNSDTLYLGGQKSYSGDWTDGGTGNSLTVDNGAWVLVGDVDTSDAPGYSSYYRGIAIGDDSGEAEVVAANGSTVDSGFSYIGMGNGDYGAVLISGANTRWENSESFYVGYKGSDNILRVNDQAHLNSGSLVIGSNVSADDNHVTVDGSNTSVHVSDRLYVGREGSGNSLVISNGGQVSSSLSYIGLESGAENNSVSVTGSNSYWRTSTGLSIGTFSANNSLLVSEGARVDSLYSYIGGQSGSANNRAVVTGEHSLWSMDDALRIGGFGFGNSLTVSDGGRVDCHTAYIGEVNGASENLVDVSGSNTEFNISHSLYVGYEGSKNSLAITDGGTVESGGGSIGTKSDDNAVLVDGAGSAWKISGGIALGRSGDNNTVAISSGGLVSSGWAEIGGTSYWQLRGDDNSVLISGTGSAYTIANEVKLGSYGSGNSLQIEAGGYMESASAYVGYSSVSERNDAVVNGSGSVWSNSDDLHIGYEGSNNSLSILESGAVYNDTGYIGYASGADNNSVVVGDTGSVWHNRDRLYLGGHYEGDSWVNGGTGNSLTVTNGGLVLVGNVTNPSRVDADGGIVVGDASGDAEMVVANQSYVEASRAYIGLGVSESGSVLLTGSNTVWDVNNTQVGYEGSDNVLSITDGAKAIGTISIGIPDGLVGYSGGVDYYYQRGSNNVLSVTDGGQVVGSIYVDGLDGALIVTNGGSVVGSVYIDGDGNTAIIAGADSFMSADTLNVGGVTGDNNTLSILDGATVYSFIGGLSTPFASDVFPTSTNNTVRVSGDGSTWKIGKDGNTHFLNGWLDIGNGALLIEDGGTVLAEYSTVDGVDYYDGAYHNDAEVSVDGTGSVWSTATMLYMRGGVVTVSDGGRVDAASLETAYSASLTVTDEGSSLNVADELLLGYGRPGSVLEILNGGAVYSAAGYIGAEYYGSPETNNSVLVSGEGSVWQNYGGLYLGGHYEGANWVNGSVGNTLTVENGGRVLVGDELHNRNYSILDLDPGGRIDIATNYYQDATSMLRFGVDTNSAGAPVNALITVGGTAEFEAGAKIVYASNVGELQFDRFYTNKLVEADALVVAGIHDPDYHDLELLDASGSLVDVIFWENDQDIYALAGRKWLAESAGFVDGTMMARLANEIDDLSLTGDPGANIMINLLNTMSGNMQNAQLTQQYERGTPNQLHIQGMTEGLGELSKQVSRRPARAPEGAEGPHRVGQGPRGWVKPYGSWADYVADGAFSGYDHNVYGTLVGVDWLQQSNILFGVAGGYVRSVINQDDGDLSEAKTGYGVVYVSLGTEAWYGDINMAFGRSSIEDKSGTAFGTRADYKAGNLALYLGGGREIRFGNDRFCLTPQGSILLSSYQQDDHVETGVMPRRVEAYDRQSAISGLGASLAMQQEFETMILKPEVRARWLHEFNADIETVDYSLVNGTGEYHYLMPAAEEDILEAGAGLTSQFNDELSLELDIDWRFGEDYDAYALGGRLIYEF